MKAALKDLTGILLGKNRPGEQVGGVDLGDLIEISLIKFAYANDEGGTNNGRPYNGTYKLIGDVNTAAEKARLDGIIEDLYSGGGTNWDKALREAIAEANHYKTTQPNEQTSVIFITDGVPTSWGDTNTEGVENRDNTHKGWEEADEEARQIVTDGFTLYDIFAFGTDTTKYDNDGDRTDADYLRALTNFAYSGTGTYANTTLSEEAAKHFFNAKDPSQLYEAFQTIINNISDATGYADVKIVDGVTGMTSTALVNGNAGNFRYVVASYNTEETVLQDLPDGAEVGTTRDANGTITTYARNEDNTYTMTVKTVASSANVTKSGSSLTLTFPDGTTDTIHQASYDPATKKVTWNLGDDYQLRDGYTYEVLFTVWPSQLSYDLVADLNNGLAAWQDNGGSPRIVYGNNVPDDLLPVSGQRTYGSEYTDQIVNSGGTYSLRTNTKDGNKVDYNSVQTHTINGQTTEVKTPGTESFVNPDPVGLAGSKVDLEKKWDDDLHSENRPSGPILLDLDEDGERYLSDISLDSSNNWKRSDFAIAPGLMVSEGEIAYGSAGRYVTYNNKSYDILETGHDYVFSEQDIASQYELTAYTYHPMVIDGTLYDVTFTYNTQGNITGIDRIDEMTTIGATNTLRGGINITKTVLDQTNQPFAYDGTFDMTVTLTAPKDADGNFDFSHVENYYEDDEVTVKYPSVAWYYYVDANGDRIYDEALIEAGILEDSGETSQYGRIGTGEHYDGGGWFYLDFEDDSKKPDYGTVTAKVKVHPSYTLRFTNMAAGTGYSLEEKEEDRNGMQLVSIEYTKKPGDETEYMDEDSPHTVMADAENNIYVTNKTAAASVSLLKVGDGNVENPLSGVKFELYANQACTQRITKNAAGQKIGQDITTTVYYTDEEKTEVSDVPTEYSEEVTNESVLVTDANGGVEIGNLVAGTYYLKEIETAPGYNMLAGPVVINVGEVGVVTATQDLSGEQNIAKKEGDVYVVTINNPSGAELPHSGGVGTQLILAIGAGMIAAGALVLFNRRRGLIAL